MKKILFLFALILGLKATAQNYADSNILVTLTQRSAVYIGFSVRNSFSWGERLAPAYFKDYIQNGTKLDSVFTISLKASYVTSLIELLLSGQNEAVQADRMSIINGSPSIPGYTALATQIVNLSNGSSQYKQVATYIKSYYNDRIADIAASRLKIIQSVVDWSKN